MDFPFPEACFGCSVLKSYKTQNIFCIMPVIDFINHLELRMSYIVLSQTQPRATGVYVRVCPSIVDLVWNQHLKLCFLLCVKLYTSGSLEYDSSFSLIASLLLPHTNFRKSFRQVAAHQELGGSSEVQSFLLKHHVDQYCLIILASLWVLWYWSTIRLGIIQNTVLYIYIHTHTQSVEIN